MERYKIVETSYVTDQELERIINETGNQGWLFDRIQFAMHESSKRPSMAFVLFIKKPDTASDKDAPSQT